LAIFIYACLLATYNLYYHVPVLFTQAFEQQKRGMKFHSFQTGAINALMERNVTRKFAHWRFTWDWQGAYFTLGAWFSMFMGLPPRLHVKYSTKVE
jgi:hypothetical protein